MHTDHAGNQLIASLDSSCTHDRQRDRRVDRLDKLSHLCLSAGFDHAAAADDEGFFGLLDLLNEQINIRAVRLRRFHIHTRTRYDRSELARLPVL